MKNNLKKNLKKNFFLFLLIIFFELFVNKKIEAAENLINFSSILNESKKTNTDQKNNNESVGDINNLTKIFSYKNIEEQKIIEIIRDDDDPIREINYLQEEVIRPVNGYFISADYLNTSYRKNFKIDHYGIDIPVPQGSEIYASLDGCVRVRRFENDNKYNYIDLESHPEGVFFRYGHISELKVADNECVKKGQVIALTGGQPGTIGAGMTTGPHLHFEIIKHNKNIDPERWLADRGIRFNNNNLDLDHNTIKNLFPVSWRNYVDNNKGNIEEKFLHNLNQNIHILQRVEEETGVNAYLMASIWYSESGLSRKAPMNRQGLFGDYSGNWSVGEVSDDELYRMTLKAANHFQAKSEQFNNRRLTKDDWDIEAIGNALYSYNGRAYGAWTNSPYVVAYMWDSANNKQCAVDGCSYFNTRKNLGTLTFYTRLRYLDFKHNINKYLQ